MKAFKEASFLTLSLPSNPFTPKGSPFEWQVKSSGIRQSKIYLVSLGSARVKVDSFLTLSLPRGLPLTNKIVWIRQSKIY